MKFNYTNGEEAKYLVSVYRPIVQDHYYFHSYRKAKAMYNKLLNIQQEEGTSISLYDMIKDIRKEFKKF